jgi:hypothetical protein
LNLAFELGEETRIIHAATLTRSGHHTRVVGEG